MYQTLFVEWVYETFVRQVKEYLKEKQLPLKYLLVMDNPTAHFHDLDDDLPDGFDYIKVRFQPTNTTPFLQLIDQQDISSFKSSMREHSSEWVLQ